MKFKMVATDFDDTLYPRSTVISEYTKDVIKSYVAAGGIFTLCTGRMFGSIVQEAEKLGLHGDAISYQGALTKNIDTGFVSDFTPFDRDLAVEYVNFVKKFNVIVQVYVDDKLYIEKANPYSDKYSKHCKVTANVVGDLAEFLKSTDKIIHKVYCYLGDGNAPELRAAAIAEYGDRLLINSSFAYNVEAVDIRASKGKALMTLAQRYGVPAENIMSFGDNLNDMDLIESAGFGVAVGNAVDELKNKADYVAETCDCDGVAKTIEKFCL